MPSLIKENNICFNSSCHFGAWQEGAFVNVLILILLWGFSHSISLTGEKKIKNNNNKKTTILKNALLFYRINIWRCTAANVSDKNLRTAAPNLNCRQESNFLIIYLTMLSDSYELSFRQRLILQFSLVWRFKRRFWVLQVCDRDHIMYFRCRYYD